LSFTIKSSLVENDTGNILCNVEIIALYFSSFKDELLRGKIVRSSKTGIILNLHGIEVFVPKLLLPNNCDFDSYEKLWKWSYDGGDFWYDIGSEVLFKTSQVNFNKKDFVPASTSTVTNQDEGRRYMIVGVMNQEGLGPKSWWK
jgi:DNA-directed RNA polymerase subunit E'/Rpb7